MAYLVEKGRQISVTDDDLKTIAQGVSASINKMTRANFATDFISSTMQGIKVDAKFRELGLSFEEIFSEIDNMVAGRTYQKRRDEMMQKAKDRVIKSVEKATKKIKEQSEQEKLLQQAKAISEMSSIMPESDEGMQTGELLRSYYIFLSAHYKKDIPDVWEYLYNLLNIEDEQQKFYDAFDPLYDRPYIVAHNLTMSYDEMKTCIIEAGDKIIHKTNEQSLELFDNEKSPLEQYIRKQVRFSFSPPECTQFLENLKEYVGNNHAQCCYCGSSFRTGKWMAADVPSDIKVQYFSNRLSGGQAEPKRYVCELCNTHFMLHKLNYPGVSPGGVGKQGVKTYYLHLFPYSFHSDIFLKALRTEIKRLNVDVSSLYAKTERAIRDYIANERVNIPFSQAKRNGFPLPKFSEIQGNILVFPVNCMGQNDSERFLFAVENALLMQRYLGCKVMLTDSSISILEKTEFDDVYIDSIPVAFAGLLPTNNLSNVELEQVWHRLKILYQIKGTVYSDGEEMPVLIRALSENELTLFYVCERFILKKLRNAKGSTDKDWLEIHLSKRITTLLDALIERGDNMEQLKQLARIAWEGRLKGETLKKNSLMIPFDMAFDKLQRKSEFIDLETLQAALSEDIFAYLERTAKADFKPGATKREKIKAFVETFFAGLLKEVYHNNVNKLLADEKMLKSAFLFYVREQIPTKKGEE